MKLKFRSKSRVAEPGKLPPGPQGDGAADPVLPPESEMSFLDHLEELRWSLIKGFLGVLVTTIVAFIFGDWIVDELLIGPAESDFFMYKLLGIDADTLVLQNRTVTGQFFAYIGIIMAVGIVLGSPVFIYCMWKFIEPGLYPTEKSGLRFASAFATFFFMLGIFFGYCIITPFALQFFANFQISDLIVNEFDIMKYFSMVTWWSFGAGILFELPVVVYFLAKLGIATPERLRKSRKYGLLTVLVIGALFTPPDPWSQLLVALPLMLLYEGSIYIAAWAERKRQRELKKAWGEDPASET